MPSRTGRFSPYLRPLQYIIDVCAQLVFAIIFDLTVFHFWVLCIYLIITWSLSTFINGFYKVYRFTSLLKILNLLGKQLLIFTLVTFTFFGFFNEIDQDARGIILYILYCMCFISLIKIGIFNVLKKYRISLGGNLRKVIILGKNQQTHKLQEFFNYNPAYGYQLVKVFDMNTPNQALSDIFEFLETHRIDEIYCSIKELKNRQLSQLIRFADNNLKVIKFLPDNKNIYRTKFEYQYYGITPILSLRSIPIEKPINQLLKRGLDVLVSLAVIVFVLSWLTPIIAICIKLESKGPIFFRQKRNGLDYKEFYCYKFRSMQLNKDADLEQVKRGDTRITKVGKFLRKTSIDELPQFINVVFGEMSIVGPRPHMVSHTHMYAATIDKFMVRHLIKPGITGLAQVSGYRGEVEKESDIKNRVRFDIFYLENWSLLMDMRIMAKTVVNIIKGDSKAY